MLRRFVAAMAVCVLTLSCTPKNPKFSFSYAEKRGTLTSNGLRFVIVPDSTTDLVQVDVRYDVGSREDPPGKAGLAHMVEHLMFQTRPDGPDKPPLFESIATLSTFFNAYTNWDTTHYQTQARKELMPALLKIEAIRLFHGCDTISKDEFEREREVVRNEIRQRGGTPEGLIVPLTLQAMYPVGHPYREEIGGNDAQLSSITLEDACQFMRDYYTPENATVIVAGGVDVDEVAKTITTYFGKIPARTTKPRATITEVKPAGGRVTHKLDIERNIVVVGWPLPSQLTPEGESVMFGINSAFFDVASKAEEYGFATSVSPAILGGRKAPTFAIIMELKSAGSAGEAIEFAKKAAAKAWRGFDEGTWQQLERIKSLRKASLVAGIEQLTERTNLIGDLVQFAGDVKFESTDEYLLREFDKIEKFDGARIGAAVKKHLSPDKMQIITFEASKEGLKGDTRSKLRFATKSHDKRVASQFDPAEAKQPIKVAMELRTLAGAERYRLGNGLDVVLLPVDAMPIVSAGLIFHAGDAHAAPLVADAAARFLRLPMDAEAMMATGISPSCYSSTEHTICTAGGINIYLDVIINSLERLIRAGEYSQDAIESWQKSFRSQQALKSTQQDNEYARQLLSALYGPEHPYTKTGVAHAKQASGIDKDSLTKFRNRHYTAANATLLVVGKFEAKGAKKMISKAFKSWSRGGRDEVIPATQRERSGPEFIGVIGREGPQVQVTIAYPAPAGIDGMHAARTILARMMSNRVAEIRTKLGSTYGVYAGFSPRVGPGSYRIGGSVDAARAGESIAAMREAVESLRRGDNFDVEFVRARREIINDLLGESTVTSELLQRLATIAMYGLKDKHYDAFLKQIAAMSTAQVKAVIAKELPATNEIIVLMADRPALEKAFTEAGLTGPTWVEPSYE